MAAKVLRYIRSTEELKINKTGINRTATLKQLDSGMMAEANRESPGFPDSFKGAGGRSRCSVRTFYAWDTGLFHSENQGRSRCRPFCWTIHWVYAKGAESVLGEQELDN